MFWNQRHPEAFFLTPNLGVCPYIYEITFGTTFGGSCLGLSYATTWIIAWLNSGSSDQNNIILILGGRKASALIRISGTVSKITRYHLWHRTPHEIADWLMHLLFGLSNLKKYRQFLTCLPRMPFQGTAAKGLEGVLFLLALTSLEKVFNHERAFVEKLRAYVKCRPMRWDQCLR